jgi:hypothetical protein
VIIWHFRTKGLLPCIALKILLNWVLLLHLHFCANTAVSNWSRTAMLVGGCHRSVCGEPVWPRWFSIYCRRAMGAAVSGPWLSVATSSTSGTAAPSPASLGTPVKRRSKAPATHDGDEEMRPATCNKASPACTPPATELRPPSCLQRAPATWWFLVFPSPNGF